MRRTKTKLDLFDHAEIARDLRDAENALLKIMQPRIQQHLYAHEIDQINCLHKKIGVIKARLEDVMFTDDPMLEKEWSHLYFGDEFEWYDFALFLGVVKGDE